MFRSLPLLACALVVALPPVTAAAKEVVGGQACGAAECIELSEQGARPILEGGPEVAPPARAAAFYELRARVRADEDIVVVRAAFVPSAGLLRTEEGTWMAADATALRRSVAGLAPRPARALPALAPEVAAPPAAPVDDGGLPGLALGGAGLAAALGLALVWRRRAVAPS